MMKLFRSETSLENGIGSQAEAVAFLLLVLLRAAASAVRYLAERALVVRARLGLHLLRLGLVLLRHRSHGRLRVAA